MKTNGTPGCWLNCSIFYHHSNLSLLLSECLNPFLSKFHQIDSEACYLFLLGNIQGDHIKLSLKVDLPRALKTVEEFQRQVNEFLTIHPSNIPPFKYPLNSFFMNFPTNTVQFNLYSHLWYLNKKNDSSKFRFFISRSLVETLEKHGADKESIITFLLEAYASFIKVYFNDKKVEKKVCDNLFASAIRGMDFRSVQYLFMSINRIFTDNELDIRQMRDRLCTERLAKLQEIVNASSEKVSFEEEITMFREALEDHLNTEPIQHILAIGLIIQGLK